MNKARRRKAIDDYLRRLERSLGDVPADICRDLVDEVREHIKKAWAASTQRTDAAFWKILDRLGTPEALARAERRRLGLEAPRQSQGPDLLALTAVGLTVVLWPVGLVLVWLSSRWTTPDKLVATAMPIVGVALMFVSLAPAPVPVSPQPVAAPIDVPREAPLAPGMTPAPEPSLLVTLVGGGLMLLGLGAPLLAAIYLALRMGPHPRRSAVLVPVLSGVLVLLGLVVVLLMPAGGVSG